MAGLFRKSITLLGSITLVVLLLAVLAPRAARGVAAALVQVVNTPANPIPTLDASTSFPFEAFPVAGNTIDPSLATFAVPSTTSTGAAVKRLVIEQVSAACFITTDSRDVEAALAIGDPVSMTSVIPSFAFPLVVSSPDDSSEHLLVTPTLVHINVAPGTNVHVGLSGAFTATGGGACNFSLIGHLETQ